jgi:hypothetical protein
MKTYRVLASQLVYYTKTIEANSQAEAEELAWEQDTGDDWKDISYGDWELVDIEEFPDVHA